MCLLRDLFQLQAGRPGSFYQFTDVFMIFPILTPVFERYPFLSPLWLRRCGSMISGPMLFRLDSGVDRDLDCAGRPIPRD